MEGGRADKRTFIVSFPWRDFSLNYLLNGLQGQDFHVCGCQHLCVLVCYGMLRGNFLHFTHAFPPRGMWHCQGKNWIKLILSLCSSSPQPLCSCLYTLTHSSPPLLLSVSPVHQWAVMFGGWPQSLESQDVQRQCDLSHIVSVSILYSHTWNQQIRWLCFLSIQVFIVAILHKQMCSL